MLGKKKKIVSKKTVSTLSSAEKDECLTGIRNRRVSFQDSTRTDFSKAIVLIQPEYRRCDQIEIEVKERCN